MIEQLKKCRICGTEGCNLASVVNLGEQAIASVFPKDKNQDILKAPLELVKCVGECGLLQLAHTLDRDLMYGRGYGYRSGINRTMTEHLKNIVDYALCLVKLQDGDAVIDIGSNDGTLLNFYPSNIKSIGIDPSGEKFRNLYPRKSILIADYFDSKLLGDIKAKIITSIAMFYDLPDPFQFILDIKHCLAPDGIWITEQAYMPTMIKNNSFDTVCHEHLEYYGMSQIKYMADKAGLDIIDASLSDTNGGSFMLTLAHAGAYKVNNEIIDLFLEQEKEFDSLVPFFDFQANILSIKAQLNTVIKGLNAQKKTVFGYGASTKGNVILQYCGFTNKDILFMADRNPAKDGCFTPATHIPIISEELARRLKPDYFLVLPWCFKKEMVEREKDYLDSGGKFIFPLPKVTIFPSGDYTLGGAR